MNEKKTSKKESINSANSELLLLVEKKIDFFKDVMQKTIIHVQKNKMLDILGINDVNTCIEKLGDLSNKIEKLTELKENDTTTNEELINNLQIINNELSGLFKSYGTDSLEDLILICFGNNNKFVTENTDLGKFELLQKYFHPTSYKITTKKDDKQYDDNTPNLTCYDVVSNFKQFHMKVFGIKIYVKSEVLKKSLIIYGILDDIVINYLNNKFVLKKRHNILNNLPNDIKCQLETFDKFMSSLILKDYLIYDSIYDIYNKFIGNNSYNVSIKQKQISQVVKEFISDDLYNKRNTLISLLIKSSNYENQYLAYLLYDLLSNDSNGNVDTQEQTILFDSFPWPIKQHFKHAMKKTVQYTNELSNFDINKIPLEQQICLLKTTDSVKEKAMMKLKEVKSKSEDSGSKARQYLDGLLKIPFNVYKREPILNVMETIRTQFKDMYKKNNINNFLPNVPCKEKYTNVEILKYTKQIQNQISLNDNQIKLDQITKYLVSGDKKQLIINIKSLNTILDKFNTANKKNDNNQKIKYATLSKEQLKEIILNFIELCKLPENIEMVKETIHIFYNCSKSHLNEISLLDVNNDISVINNNLSQITSYMINVKSTLDNAVHGHNKAKKQIERIIGQWINGDVNNTKSHVLGFEGSPGIGKTTLAKGLASCLKDENGVSRPFALIALGGDSNASTLLGHSYTYVGSSWSQLVQILMDSKCMNPIILFDEVDKISKTEHGKEITGVLTHLLDTTQNNTFQDKYFSGIDLDFSKALFILSYNDVDAIDKVLLDRVHQIKFDSLTIEDKIVISNTHLLPDLYKQVGLEDMIYFTDDVLKFIIEEYTLEPGVRKLKEKLFEIIGDLNLNILKNINDNHEFPIEITIDDIKNNFFKDKREIFIRKVPENSIVGYANGMYATVNSIGGVLPIHAKFFPCEHFLELKLTGLQQDVMRESMHVSLTVAWNLTSEERKIQIRKLYDGKNNKYGINIHPGDGSVQKDGPSAGGIITVVLYSLLNNIPIRAQMAMTGEIQMNGDITAIGGLKYKILGSIKAGVKEIIYPKENKKDFDEFYEKYKDDTVLKGITFHSVNCINEAFGLILEM